MDLQQLRQKVVQSFDPESGAYSHVTPYKVTHFIDGMAWVGMLSAAAHMSDDTVIAHLADRYLQKLCNLGSDVRSFSPYKISDRWESRGDLFVLRKEQAFAGPAALWFAIENGANIDPKDIKKPEFMSKLLVMTSGIIGILIKYNIIASLRQHVNTIMFAHLLQDKTPPRSMKFLTYDNPLYAYVYGELRGTTEWPPLRETENGHTDELKELVPMKDRKPGAWPAKNWPHKKYVPSGPEIGDEFTPTCELISYYFGTMGMNTLG